MYLHSLTTCVLLVIIARAERDGTRAEIRFRLSPKRTTPFKSVGASVQSTAGSRSVRISFSNAGYTMFGCGVRVLATHSIRQFPLHFTSRASPCAIRFRTSSTREIVSGEDGRCMSCEILLYANPHDFIHQMADIVISINVRSPTLAFLR